MGDGGHSFGSVFTLTGGRILTQNGPSLSIASGKISGIESEPGSVF
jgi:hypothetical protein